MYPGSIKRAIRHNNIINNDIIITAGGASVGDEDHLIKALSNIGNILESIALEILPYVCTN